MKNSDFKSCADKDHAYLDTEWPVQFYVNNVGPLTGQRDQTVDSLLGGDAGYLQQWDFNLLVRLAVFSLAGIPPLTSEAEIEIADATGARTSYRVKRAVNSPDGISVNYELKADN